VGIAPGSIICCFVQLVGSSGQPWDARGFALANNIFTVDTGDPTMIPAGVPPLIGTGIDPYTGMIVVLPEPTAFSLTGLGAAALLIFRRRK
jgi:hypothetical protein